MFRQLYILALFQLLGGPLVLLAVLAMGKLVTASLYHEGIGAGVAKLCDGASWETITDTLLDAKGQGEASREATPEFPKKSQDGKGVTLTWETPQRQVFGVAGQLVTVPEACSVFYRDWRLRPPSPPPRWS